MATMLAPSKPGTWRSDHADHHSLALTSLWLASILGWCMNILALIGSVGGPLNAMFVARCIGAFVAPLGAILGYF